MDEQMVKESVRMFLTAIGEDPDREGLLETPGRIANMVKEVFAGIGADPGEHLVRTFDENHEEMVLVSNIPMYSFCEHHLLPFFGKAHVAYIPHRGKVTGISKLARVVDGYSRRPQIQERLTGQIADAVMEKLQPYGVMVVIEAEHLCMTIRGVNKPGARTTTSATRGIFRTEAATRAEALALIKKETAT
ncbi:MAG: GTP cyclohydrolase I FolE [Peptococcaceae bacterium]|jgi:GTP cyclohydrolase I|nr:GTP cyclohydrolase I FolE [Peptococcaceae bacterium]